MYCSIFERAVDFLFPRRCPICHQIVATGGHLICRECAKKIHLIRQPVCKRCGKELLSDQKEYCRYCQQRRFSYNYGISLARYDDVMKQSLSAVKYKNKREYLEFYSQAIGSYCGKRINNMKVDLLVPVPIHAKRYRARGFNQAELLAEGIGRALDIPVMSGELIRVKNTAPQKQLDQYKRAENLNQAFQVKTTALAGKRILLVDDIYTTGSTIEACSRLLKANGAAEIFFVTICIGGNIG